MGRPLCSSPLILVLALLATFARAGTAAETMNDKSPNADSQLSFNSPNSVGGTLGDTNQRKRGSLLDQLRAGKDALEASTGFAYGLDNNTQYLRTNSDTSPSDAAGNVFRFYGTWTPTGRDTAVDGSIVFKIEDRSDIGNNLSPQSLGPSQGYAGLYSSTFSDAGVVLTNFYWRQQFSEGRGAFVVGQVDASDYISVNSIASPWSGFTNLAFEQPGTLAIPSQGLGTAVLWHLNDNWGVMAGVADANGDPSDPFDSAKNLFDTGELFKHFAIGWVPDWDDRYDRSIQLTLWQADEREEAGVDDGQGIDFLASARIGSWRPFIRAGYAEDAGVLNERAFSIGTGYDARGGLDLAGFALNWAQAPDSSRDQYTLETFYRYDVTDFLQLTPEVQYIVNPAHDLSVSDIFVLGMRLRIFF